MDSTLIQYRPICGVINELITSPKIYVVQYEMNNGKELK
jgi:hypothetical protein